MSATIQIVLLGEAYGAQEAQAKAPFVGASGSYLNKLCGDAGILTPGATKLVEKALWERDYITRDSIYAEAGVRLTNVFNLQPKGNKIEDLCGPKHDARPPIRMGKYVRAEFYPELARLAEELAEWQPNIIVGLGATALWYTTGNGAITKKRGTLIDSAYGKFLATFHPAYLMYPGGAKLRPVVLNDLAKAKRHSDTAVITRPARTVHIPETIANIASIFPRLEQANIISIDIETAAEQITCIGFAWSKDEALVIPIWDTRKSDNCYWPLSDELAAWHWIRRICALPVAKVLQNGLYDLHYLWRRYGITVVNPLHDTMLLHHALYPEAQKSLAFLGSLYTDEVAWKEMRNKTTLKREDDE